MAADYGLPTTGRKSALVDRLYRLRGGVSRDRSPHAPSPRTPSRPNSDHLPQLELTVQRLVNRSLSGLEERLLRALRPPPASAAPAQDNISLPSPAPVAAATAPAGATAGSETEVAAPSSAVQQPPLPEKIKQRILKGEYIDFDSLLPEALYPARYGASPSPAFTLRLSHDPAADVVIAQQKPAAKRSVRDLASWMEAWNVYAQVLGATYPARATELLAYQAIICKASTRFPPQLWLRYDQRFRASAAADRTMRWDHKNNELWLNASLTHRPPHSHTHPNHRPRLPVARAHTAAAYTTTQTIAPRTLFVPLADEPALQELLNITHHPPLLLTPCSGHQSHRYQSPLHSLTPAATSITESAVAQCVGFATPALGVASGPTGKGTAPAPVDQQQLVTPLRPLILERELCTHPDNGFVRQLLHNITHGCSIGYNGPQFPHTARHLPSARLHPDIISQGIAKECNAGRMAGPYSAPPLPNTRCSGLGVVDRYVCSGGKISIDKHNILHLALNTLRGQTGLFSAKVCNQDWKLCVNVTREIPWNSLQR